MEWMNQGLEEWRKKLQKSTETRNEGEKKEQTNQAKMEETERIQKKWNEWIRDVKNEGKKR